MNNESNASERKIHTKDLLTCKSLMKRMRTEPFFFPYWSPAMQCETLDIERTQKMQYKVICIIVKTSEMFARSELRNTVSWITYEQGFQRVHTQILFLSERKATKVLNEVQVVESFRDPGQILHGVFLPIPFYLASEYVELTASWA